MTRPLKRSGIDALGETPRDPSQRMIRPVWWPLVLGLTQQGKPATVASFDSFLADMHKGLDETGVLATQPTSPAP